MIRFTPVALLFLTTAAFAQADCAVCDQVAKLRDAFGKVEIGDAAQKPRGEALARESLALVIAFRDQTPAPAKGRQAFDSLVALGGYAAPFSDGAYENVLAMITAANPQYRKRYQAIIRKGMRARGRRELCQMRYLQTNVTVAECKLQEAKAGASADLAGKRCNAEYPFAQCIAAKKK